MNNTTGIEVGTWKQATYRGVFTRTLVRFPDGHVVRFLERLPKGLAIKQAQMLRAKGG